MNTTKTNFSKNGELKTAPKNQTTSTSKMKSSQLMKLFEDELKDIYWAEKALTKAIPKMIKKATSEKLIEALTSHLTETEEQANRLEQIFKILGKKPEAEKCEAMAGLMKESEDIMEACEPGAMRDAGIISAAQKVEHYEIASYGTLSQFAHTLGLKDAVKLLDATLNEEKQADVKLTEVAVDAINMEAAEKKA
ncbi:YciE/YciF ferroxidase family protein [Flavobacterium orientale]|uniref:YciE/YciF family protein n=1 Tax=Flavobacterium orientale TaxID=1756020 RepID=A0A916Y028_9FLAO|nr:ferritin-like domain-containing protein [Flavobacterium orientale]GGD24560.1 YciE/YciF family protein [Flavobacterium orientale]